jgi:hypothetical protein
VVGCGRRVDRGADDSSLCREHGTQEREARDARERLHRQQQRQQEQQQYQQYQQQFHYQQQQQQPHHQPYPVQPQPPLHPVSGIYVVPQPSTSRYAAVPPMLRPQQWDAYYM